VASLPELNLQQLEMLGPVVLAPEQMQTKARTPEDMLLLVGETQPQTRNDVNRHGWKGRWRLFLLGDA
jgi:hypothetical protein